MSPPPDVDRLSHADLKDLVLRLLEEVAELRRTVAASAMRLLGSKGERRHQKRYGSRLPRCLSRPQVRLAQSSVSLSGITSARDLPCQVSRRSHIYRQSSGIDSRPPDSHDFCPFYSAKIEFDELTIRYHFLGDSIKQLKAVVEKNRAEGEERSRLRQ